MFGFFSWMTWCNSCNIKLIGIWPRHDFLLFVGCVVWLWCCKALLWQAGNQWHEYVSKKIKTECHFGYLARAQSKLWLLKLICTYTYVNKSIWATEMFFHFLAKILITCSKSLKDCYIFVPIWLSSIWWEKLLKRWVFCFYSDTNCRTCRPVPWFLIQGSLLILWFVSENPPCILFWYSVCGFLTDSIMSWCLASLSRTWTRQNDWSLENQWWPMPWSWQLSRRR